MKALWLLVLPSLALAQGYAPRSSVSSTRIISAVQDAGTLLRADHDATANTFSAMAQAPDGGPSAWAYVCNQSPCNWKMGAGTSESLSVHDNEFHWSGTHYFATYFYQASGCAPGTSCYLYVDPGQWWHLFAQNDISGCAAGTEGGLRAYSTDHTLRYCDGTGPRRITTDSLVTLPTCSSAVEGAIRADAASGGTSGVRTRVCICTSDGGGTPAYAWQNSATATVGTSTTCP